MKIIIPILLALFLSGNASANTFTSIKEYCGQLERMIVASKNNEWDATTEESRNYHAKAFREHTKAYHYLDCSDFR